MELTADQLAKVYIKIRDRRAKLKTEYEDADNALKEQLAILESTLLEMCKTTGVDSMRTAHGTIIKGKATRYWASDWGKMHKFILEHEATDLLERRIAQNAMKDWIEAHPDLLPPGLNSDSKSTITVRRSNS